MNIISFLLKTSRPRSWVYLSCPYLIGYVFGISSKDSFTSPLFWLLFFYFLIPANLLLYGISDYFDDNIDKKYSKKETLQKTLVVVGFVSLGIGFILLTDIIAKVLFGLVLFLSFFYSALPLRFKAHPVTDTASNILYAVPGFLGYYIASGVFPPLWVIIAAWCWMGGMYVFSSIADTSQSKKNHLQTTAVVLGKEQALMLCIVLWSFCSIILFMQRLNSPFIVLSIIYPLVPLFLVYRDDKELKKLSWSYPFLTALAGFGLLAMALSQL